VIIVLIMRNPVRAGRFGELAEKMVFKIRTNCSEIVSNHVVSKVKRQ